jgi:hypothetical protein
MRSLVFALLGVAVCVLPISAQAQSGMEISGTGGWLRASADDAAVVDGGWVGASFKARLGRPEIKVDYEFFHRNFTNEKESIHLIGAGWLVQRRSGRVRPFYQVGWTFGVQTSDRHARSGLMGLALSAGLKANVTDRLFLSPELRWKLLGPGPMMLVEPGVTLGWQF